MPPRILYNISATLIDYINRFETAKKDQIGPCVLDLTTSLLGQEVAEPERRLQGQLKPRRAKHGRLDLENVDDGDVKRWTRFTKADIHRMVSVLDIPSPIKTPKSRRSFTPFEALVILLSRLSYPCQLDMLTERFHISKSAISECINELSCFLTEKWAIPLLSFNPGRLTHARLDLFASVIASRGCPMDNIWGFLDVTIKMVCRPGWEQKELYSGYAKGHCLKYQAVVTPDGLISCCSLPLPGRRADGACLRRSGLEPLLEKHAFGVGGRRLLLWGDLAYGRSEVIASGEKEVGRMPPVDQMFFKEMAKYRQCVEWAFGKVSALFAFNNYSPNLKLHLSPIGSYFLVSVLLSNAHTCIYGSETSHFYSLQPPTLEDYFVLPSSLESADFSLSKTFEYETINI